MYNIIYLFVSFASWPSNIRARVLFLSDLRIFSSIFVELHSNFHIFLLATKNCFYFHFVFVCVLINLFGFICDHNCIHKMKILNTLYNIIYNWWNWTEFCCNSISCLFHHRTFVLRKMTTKSRHVFCYVVVMVVFVYIGSY